jgi:hypothetical protein
MRLHQSLVERGFSVRYDSQVILFLGFQLDVTLTLRNVGALRGAAVA